MEMTMRSDQKTIESTPWTFPGSELDGVGTVKALPYGIERARADISVHHAERAERERKKGGGLAALGIRG